MSNYLRLFQLCGAQTAIESKFKSGHRSEVVRVLRDDGRTCHNYCPSYLGPYACGKTATVQPCHISKWWGPRQLWAGLHTQHKDSWTSMLDKMQMFQEKTTVVLFSNRALDSNKALLKLRKGHITLLVQSKTQLNTSAISSCGMFPLVIRSQDQTKTMITAEIKWTLVIIPLTIMLS